MADVKTIRSRDIRVYRDGTYLGRLTDASLESTQNTVDREYIGDSAQITRALNKSYSGNFTRDSFDESWLETIIGHQVTTNFSVSNYTDTVDTSRETVDDLNDVDITFTTPNEQDLTISRLDFNAQRVGSFSGGLDILIRDAGDTTTLATFHVNASEIPSTTNKYITATLSPESNEPSVDPDTNYILRFTPSGSPTGSVELFGPSSETEPYYSVTFEKETTEDSTYTIDFIIVDEDGNEYLHLRDTGVVFTEDNMTMNAGELITEASGWQAKKRVTL